MGNPQIQSEIYYLKHYYLKIGQQNSEQFILLNNYLEYL